MFSRRIRSQWRRPIPQVAVDRFFSNLLPQTSIPEETLSQIYDVVLTSEYANDQWKAVAEVSTSGEDPIFRGLVTVAGALEAAVRTKCSLEPLVVPRNAPAEALGSIWAPNYACPDGYFSNTQQLSEPQWAHICCPVQCKREDDAQDGNDVSTERHGLPLLDAIYSLFTSGRH